VIDYNSDADVYQFQGVAGESVKIEANSTSGALDPAVTLFFDASRLFPRPPRPGQSATEAVEFVTESYADPLAQQGRVFVDITSPPDQATIPIPQNPTNIQLAGKAGVLGTGVPANLEVCIVLDVSGSVDDQEHSLQVAGVRAILAALDPDGDGALSSAVALVQFHSTAAVVVPLTRSRAQVDARLGRIGSGSTNYRDAFEKALAALAPSSATDNISELVLFFSDGAPDSGSYQGPGQGGPLDRFRPAGIRIDTFGIGGGVSPTVLREIAQTTGGTYTAIPAFADVAKVTASLPGVVGLRSVEIDTNGDGRGDVTASVGVDGSFTATVPCRAGRNTYTAIATATDQTLPPATDTITVYGQLATRVGTNIEVVHDDNSGPGNNALIDVAQLPVTGRYIILVAASKSASSGGYELVLSPVDKDSNAAGLLNSASQFSLFNTRTPNQVMFSATQGAPFSFLGYSPNGETAAILNSAGQFTLASAKDPNQVIFSATQGAPFTFLGFAPDGESAALLNSAGQLAVFSTRMPNQTIFSATQGAPFTFLGFAPDGESGALLNSVGQFTLFSTKNSNQTIFSATQGAPFTFVGFAPDGDSAALLNSASQFTLFSTKTLNQTIFSATQGAPFVFAGYAPDGEAGVVLNSSGQLTVFSTKMNNQTIFSATQGAPFVFLGFGPDGQTGTMLNSASQFTLFSAKDPNQTIFSATQGAPFTFAGYAPDGETGAILNSASQLTVFSARRANQVLFSATQGAPFTFVGYAPDGETATILNSAMQLTLLSARNANEVVFSATQGAPFTFLGYSPTGEAASILNSASQFTLFSTRSNNQTIFSATQGAPFTFQGYGPDGLTAAILNSAGQFTLFSARTANQTIFSATQGAPFVFLGYAPDGVTAAILNSASQFTLFSTRTANQTIFSATQGAPFSFSGFAPDGETAAILNSAGQLSVFSARDANQTIFSATQGAPFTFVGYSLDGEAASILNSAGQFTLFNTRAPNQVIFSATQGAPFTFSGYSFDRTRGTSGGRGPNDTCANAREITTLPFTETLDTTKATSSNDDPLQSCTLGGPSRNSNSVWYKFTPSTNGVVTADTAGSSYDTILSAHTGSCGSLTEAACDDDSGGGFNSQVRLDVTGGRTYLFMITGFGAKSAGGTLVFNFQFSPRGQRIIRVAQRGGGDFTSVQTAIDDAKQGEIVEIIDSETYRENLRITTNGITVRAAQGRSPIIDGSTREGNTVEIDGATGVTIERLTIRGGNTATGRGAGVRAQNGAGVTLTSNVIANNDRGVSNAASQVVLRSNRIETNEGTGIIFFAGSSGSIEGNTIQNNNDGDSSSPFDRGIEIQNLTQTLEIKNNTISGNASQGVIVFSSTVTLTDNRISGNVVGVLATVSSSTAVGAVVNVRNNTIENHREEGIALFAQTSGEITGNKVLNNNDRNANTFFDRGIELVNTAGEFLIQNNEITGNGNQGVIIFSTRARLINNLINNNTAGVVLNASSDTPNVGAQVTLINNTIASNRDLGVGTVSGSNSRAIIVNSIISGNTDDLDGVASADVSFTLIGDGTFATQNNNLTGDPRFVSSSGGNFRLQSNSPAIDRGSNAAISGVTTDLAGNTRVVDGDRNGTATVDCGAYEVQ
jgi:hypothetical protein